MNKYIFRFTVSEYCLQIKEYECCKRIISYTAKVVYSSDRKCGQLQISANLMRSF